MRGPKNGPVVTLVPPAFSKQAKYHCEMCGMAADYFVRVPNKLFQEPEWMFLCEKHNQSCGLGFGEDIGMKIEVLEDLLEGGEEDAI